eukprot:757444-Hanusia_phi.AAC.1
MDTKLRVRDVNRPVPPMHKRLACLLKEEHAAKPQVRDDIVVLASSPEQAGRMGPRQRSPISGCTPEDVRRRSKRPQRASERGPTEVSKTDVFDMSILSLTFGGSANSIGAPRMRPMHFEGSVPPLSCEPEEFGAPDDPATCDSSLIEYLDQVLSLDSAFFKDDSCGSIFKNISLNEYESGLCKQGRIETGSTYHSIDWRLAVLWLSYLATWSSQHNLESIKQKLIEASSRASSEAELEALSEEMCSHITCLRANSSSSSEEHQLNLCGQDLELLPLDERLEALHKSVWVLLSDRADSISCCSMLLLCSIMTI